MRTGQLHRGVPERCAGEGGGGGGEDGEAQEKATKLSFGFYPGQREIVDLAIEKGKEIAESDKPSHVITHICQEFLATNTSTMNINDFLKNVERLTSLKIVALKLNENEEDDIVYGADYLEKGEGNGEESVPSDE